MYKFSLNSNKGTVLFFLLSFFIGVYAQDKPVTFDHFTTRDGLSQNRIYGIIQDSLGFIWFGTEDGLNRYDGYNFKVFKNIPGDTTSLVENIVTTFHLTKKGELWVGGPRTGLARFNAQNETFTTFLNDHSDPRSLSENFVKDISEDEKGNLWIATNSSGFDYYDSQKNIFLHMANLVPRGYELNNEILNFIHQDKSGYLWVGGKGKLHLFKVEYTSEGIPALRPVRLNTDVTEFNGFRIKEDKSGNIWISSFNNGLFRYDKDNKTLKPVDLVNSNQLYKKSTFLSIEFDDDGHMWLAGLLDQDSDKNSLAQGIGLLEVDFENSKVRNFQYDPKNDKGLSSNWINVIYNDRTGTMWIGTDLFGINRYDKSVVKFSLFKPEPFEYGDQGVAGIRGFYEEENVLWIISADGLISYNRKTDQYEHFVHDPKNKNSISSDEIRAIYNDGNYLWLGTTEGLNRFNKRTKTNERIFLDENKRVEKSENRVNSFNYNILELDEMPGILWYGSSGGGLVKLNKKDFTYKNYTYDPETQNSLNNRQNFARFIWQSDSFPNELWVGTTHGINIFNLETETFRYYEHDPKNDKSISHNNAMHFYQDEDGYIWISTYGGGLNRFDPKTETFLRFTESNSDIPNNGVYGVLPDEQGNLWMSTNNGISKFNPKTFEFRNYTVDDGLQGEEFNGGALYKSKDGEMFFGGINGFNCFYPAEVKDNKISPEIVITDVKIFNKSLRPGKDSPLKKPIYNTTELVLPYWQNDISFDFVGVHYAKPSKNKYAFMLENYEDNWRYSGSTRTATYTNLDYGEYIFHVKGSNLDGLWNEHGRSLKLTILPPWWQTGWAYAGYFLAFVMIIFVIDRIQRARLLAKARQKHELALLEAENERKTKELEEARQLQLSMLPKELPQLPHLDIAVYMETATEVGGDYYDFHVALDGTLTVVIGDATGHGMKAGTMVTTAKSLFNSYAPNPDILYSFQEITRCIKQMNFGKQLSMCMTMLKIQGNKLTMSVAGMPPAFVFRKDTRVVEEHLFQAMPLGTMDKFPYEIKDTTIKPGDTILLMSDGLPELTSDSGEMYGYKRIRNNFEDVAEQAPEDIISFFKNEGSGWINNADPDDDVTFVVIKVK
ncbi:MAG: SpoIIE family protein phosphatase [Calditrichaeota bacterium]|nr:SpoIIE family protein phosphatase [Calditrichota bacterium]